jgi:hypothetical protein
METIKEESNKSKKNFILDPLSVIIKLALLGYKQVGTKINISNNIVQLQEVGIFQSLVRMVQKNNKSDLQYLYNPIEFASRYFLSEEMLEKFPNMRAIFESALKGITKLTETYKEHLLVVICLHFYRNILTNYLEEIYTYDLFIEDELTKYYDDELLNKMEERWTDDKLQLLLEMNDYLVKNESSNKNIDCLELFIKNLDIETQNILKL